MATKKCTKCKEEIQEDAKKCKHCGSDLRNWFIRHKILTVILALLAIGVIGSMANDGTTNNNSSTSSSNSNKTVVEEPTTKITKTNCDAVKTGMTKEQVINLLGEPSSTSESEIAGLGKSEYLHFQEGFSMQACSVTTSNGKVSSRTWTDL